VTVSESQTVRIYDTFLFDGELDLLEHRLRETFDLVDRFVLVEAAETFRGERKPLMYSANRERFAWAAAKILPVALNGLGGPSRTSWDRQAFQRNAILLGLADARPDDIVLLLDSDEIVSRSLLERLRTHGLDGPHRLAMTRHYEYLDQIGPRSPCCPPLDAAFAFEADRIRPGDWDALDAHWHGHSGIAVRHRDIVDDSDASAQLHSPYAFRRLVLDAPLLPQAGRHFVAVDPGARLESKLGRVSHAELGDARAKYPYFLERARTGAVHHHGWWYAETPTGPLPEDLQRLAERTPAARRPGPMPPMRRRRLFRSWAWLRYWPVLPDNMVYSIDRHFAVLVFPLAPLLLMADMIRAMGARFRWRWLRGMSSSPGNQGHG